MKKFNLKKIVLIGFFSITIFSAFLTPATTAQVWTYNGANTQPIPHFSVYPSEWYVYNDTRFPQRYIVEQISHGNISDYGIGNGYSVWTDNYYKNKTSGELEYISTTNLGSWNDSIGYQGYGFFLPVEDDGKVSQSILDNVLSYFLDNSVKWEHNQTDINYYSISTWNTTINNFFIRYNYTDRGIQTKYLIWGGVIPFPNRTIVSWPAQLPPEFSFTTEDGVLNINSANIKLNVSIVDADNNNNGITDTDYLYRILIDSTWTNWTTLPALIDYDLSSIPSGSHQITVEVKNMYGITQEQIIVQYTAPPPDNGISGYSTILISILLFFSASIILFRHRKKSKYRK
ncbi:hypothetical protein LCGC14_1563100 [marine sediment metagenome]|uniref:Uncharacterized protein n=1 Tax=marine sediment metagenome TaxID=412755 RepID=A0A0F9ILV7_9ZZZZ